MAEQDFQDQKTRSSIEARMMDLLTSELKASRKETKEGLENIETAVKEMSNRVASQATWNIAMVVILVLGMVATTGGSLYIRATRDSIEGSTGSTASYNSTYTSPVKTSLDIQDIP